MLRDAKRKNPRSSTDATSFSPLQIGGGILFHVDNSPKPDANDALRQHVERLLAAAGTTATRVSLEAGLNPHYVSQWLNGRVRSPTTEKLGRIAAALSVSLEELTTPIGETTAAGEMLVPEGLARKVRLPILPTGRPLPVRYAVQAGAWIEVDGMAQARITSPPVTADPRFPLEMQWLEIVRGDSADLYFPEGAFVHVADAIAIGYAPRDEDFVVVERKREQGGLIERSLKQIVKKGRRLELWPRSRNPKWNAPLKLDESTDDETTVEIAALVLGGYLPARR